MHFSSVWQILFFLTCVILLTNAKSETIERKDSKDAVKSRFLAESNMDSNIELSGDKKKQYCSKDTPIPKTGHRGGMKKTSSAKDCAMYCFKKNGKVKWIAYGTLRGYDLTKTCFCYTDGCASFTRGAYAPYYTSYKVTISTPNPTPKPTLKPTPCYTSPFDKPCLFPFKFQGRMYNKCAPPTLGKFKPWCNVQGGWDYCKTDCSNGLEIEESAGESQSVAVITGEVDSSQTNSEGYQFGISGVLLLLIGGSAGVAGFGIKLFQITTKTKYDYENINLISKYSDIDDDIKIDAEHNESDA